MLIMIIETEEESLKAERLYIKYGRDMYAGAMEILGKKEFAEEAVLEAFKKIIDKYLHIIDESETGNAKYYLIRLCKNTAKKIKKKRDVIEMRELPEELIKQTDIYIATPEDIVMLSERKSETREIIKNMDEKYREALILKYEYKFTDEQIGEFTGEKKDTVRKRITRGKAILAEKLKEYERKENEEND